MTRLLTIVARCREKEDRQLRLLLAYLWRLRQAGDRDTLDRFMANVRLSKMSPVLLVAVLTVTRPMKSLSEHGRFYRSARKAIVDARGESEASEILRGLE